MNAPERYESYVLEPDQVKIEYNREESSPNSGRFKILKEDHTVGNLIRMKLLQDPRVYFAGYKSPHPLLNEIDFRVRTNGSISPPNAIIDTIDKLLKTIEETKKKFEREVEKKSSQLQQQQQQQHGDSSHLDDYHNQY